VKGMSRPNGIGLSPDGKMLYVANSDPAKAIWMMFPVKADGTVGDGKQMYDTTEHVKAKKPGLPDGLKVDQSGNVWATGPGGVYVFDASGKLLGTIVTNDKTGNCCFGDDGSTLYICANHHLIRIKTKVKGIGF
jgi:gluconolactonase